MRDKQRVAGMVAPSGVFLTAWRELTRAVRESLVKEDLEGALKALDARERWISEHGHDLSRELAAERQRGEEGFFPLQKELLAEEEVLRVAFADRQHALLTAMATLRARVDAERNYALPLLGLDDPLPGGFMDRKG